MFIYLVGFSADHQCGACAQNFQQSLNTTPRPETSYSTVTATVLCQTRGHHFLKQDKQLTSHKIFKCGNLIQPHVIQLKTLWPWPLIYGDLWREWITCDDRSSRGQRVRLAKTCQALSCCSQSCLPHSPFLTVTSLTHIHAYSHILAQTLILLFSLVVTKLLKCLNEATFIEENIHIHKI